MPLSCATDTSRITSWRGRKPIRKALPPASWVAVENAIILTLASRATGFTASTSAANNGPRISCAPSDKAERAALTAPSVVPPVSRGTRVSLSPPVVNSASCAASSIDLPRSELGPDSGSSSPTLTTPPPLGGAFGCGAIFGPANGDCGATTGAATFRPPPHAVSASNSAKATRVETRRGTRQRDKDGLPPGVECARP